ncbi:hypothetical protein C6P45_000205 [Maudiozyma exigua]|uniref:Pre-mRNA-processing factor 17 n=1 Tax=Maudiozyma exigua TaxID=34358 RepID=A0A9P6W752_MAUEX|nr:hypothetical protein C6P45_000205 [Kazachstania exigua]
MSLIHGYSSKSDSEDGEPAKVISKFSQLNPKFVNRMKKRSHLTKSELKQRKQARKAKGPWGSWSSDDEEGGDDESQADHVQTNLHAENETTHQLSENESSEDESNQNSDHSTFYGEGERFKEGRGILKPPLDIDTDLTKKPFTFKTYLPKKIKYIFPGHTNGTTSLKFLPNTGHLFLSGGSDSTIRLWDFYHDRSCIRDYNGHSKVINSLDFASDGTKFLSSSYDKTVKVWDTESGQVLNRLKFKGGTSCCEFRPTESTEFIVGLSDSRILHYDMRVSERDGHIQTYDHHIGSILDVKYFQDGSKFISSSEDKTVMLWENGINIPIKHISDTAQYSMPFINTYPSQKYFCTQSMDNSIYTYDMRPKYKKLPNKTFKGQKSVGYGVGFTFSPDGHYICSGDIRSKVIFWDWTTSKLLKEVVIPGKQPITQVQWNPQETSKLICSGSSGKIYLLD